MSEEQENNKNNSSEKKQQNKSEKDINGVIGGSCIWINFSIPCVSNIYQNI